MREIHFHVLDIKHTDEQTRSPHHALKAYTLIKQQMNDWINVRAHVKFVVFTQWSLEAGESSPIFINTSQFLVWAEIQRRAHTRMHNRDKHMQAHQPDSPLLQATVILQYLV
jgi:hypothetical protein